MALHGFNDAGWEQYRRDRKHLHGGKRQVHLRKNFQRKGRAGGGGGGGSPHMLAAFVACEEPPDAPGGVFNLPNPWIWTPPAGETPGQWDPNPDWKFISGSWSHLQLLDEEDEPVLVECNDPLLKVPTTGDYCYVVGAAGATTLDLVDRRCGGGGPIP